jgi:hypothetical protein
MQHIKSTLTVLALAGTVGVAVLYRAEAIQARNQLLAVTGELNRLRGTPKARIRPEPAPAIGEPEARPTAEPDSTDPEGLLAQIQELELVLQKQDSAIAAQTAAATAPSGTGPLPPRPQDWMEDLKKSDPARYEELIRRREQARQEAQVAFAERTDFFLNRAESSRSEEDRQTYRQIAQIVDSTWQMMELLRTDLPGDQRREMMSAVRDNLRTLQPMLTAERNREWQRLSLEMGGTDSDAKALSDRINQVLRVTSTHNLFRNRPGEGGGHSRIPRDASRSDR